MSHLDKYTWKNRFEFRIFVTVWRRLAYRLISSLSNCNSNAYWKETYAPIVETQAMFLSPFTAPQTDFVLLVILCLKV